MTTINENIEKLPPDMKKEVGDFIEFLLEKNKKRHRSEPTFEWAGALKDVGKKYTSVEVQNKISELRIDRK